MLKKARQYSAAEKTKIVIDAIKSEMTIAQIRTSVKNEGIWDIIGSNWKVFNLFFIFRLAVA